MGAAAGIAIHGVNAVNLHHENDLMCEGRDIPWLQDTAEVNAWLAWDVVYRDVVILDRDNVKVGVYNLTTYDLSVPANYDALKTMLIEAAAAR